MPGVEWELVSFYYINICMVLMKAYFILNQTKNNGE
jgi:hypothetical protein